MPHQTLSYKDKNQYTNVYLNGVLIGYILCSFAQWFYSPKGMQGDGRKMESRRAVKEELGRKLRDVLDARGLNHAMVHNELAEQP